MLLRAIHADELFHRFALARRPPHRVAHIVGVDHQARRMVVEIIFEFVGELHIDQCGDRADTPTGEHPDQVIQPVMRKDGNAIAGAHPQIMQGAGEVRGGLYRLRVSQRLVAIDPAQRHFARLASGTVQQQLMHQHSVSFRSAYDRKLEMTRRGATASDAKADDAVVDLSGLGRRSTGSWIDGKSREVGAG